MKIRSYDRVKLCGSFKCSERLLRPLGSKLTSKKEVAMLTPKGRRVASKWEELGAVKGQK